MQKKRIGYIDILKAICIIGIMAAHITVCVPAANSGIIGQVFPSLGFGCGVQGFFIASGFFFSTKRPFNAGKELRHTMLPYAVSCVIIIVAGTAINQALYPTGDWTATATKWTAASVYMSGSLTYPMLWPSWIQLIMIGGLWFLPAMFWGKLFIAIIRKIPTPRALRGRYKEELIPVLLILALFLISYITISTLKLPFAIQPGMGTAFWMYLGLLIRKFGLFDDGRIAKPIWVVLLLVWVAGLLLTPGSYPDDCEYPHGIIDIVVSICGVFCLVAFSKFVEKHLKWPSRAIQAAGRNTLPIFCSHIIDLDILLGPV
ncbi:MAG: acyltransferase, partial [Coriobacteriales bacterium]|nr:acyltransferase [Coriobacteriales bacterium]